MSDPEQFARERLGNWEDDRVIAPRRRLSARHRVLQEQGALVMETNALLRRVLDNMLEGIKHQAGRKRTLLAGKPQVTITIEVDWDGFEFPEDAQDVFESEQIAQALGMEVAPGVDHLVVQRPTKMTVMDHAAHDPLPQPLL